MDDTLGRYHRCGSCGYVIGPSEHTGELVGRCPTYCSTDAVTFTPTEITFPPAPSREAVARDTRDVEAQIRQTYARLARPGGHMKLADLRAALPPDLDRETVDAALTKLGVHSDVHLWPNSDQKQASPADQAAALRFGGGYDHTIMIEAGPQSIADVYRRVKSTDRVHAESMLAPLDRWQLERLADRFETADGRTGLIYTNRDDDTLRAHLAQESATNHEAWLAKANQEVADGTLLYQADNDPEWVASWTDEDRATARAAAERQSQMDWDVGRERGRRWLDRLGEGSQAERDGIQREPVRGEEATQPDAPCADDPARTADPHARGVADGYAGGPHNPDLFADDEHGQAYRAGLQEGRTAAVDEELTARYGPEPAGPQVATGVEADTFDQEVTTIEAGFEYELCGDCDKDLDEHVIAEDPLGHAHAACRADAAEASPLPDTVAADNGHDDADGM